MNCLALGSLWGLTCGFCVESARLVLAVLRGLIQWPLLASSVLSQPNAPLKGGPPKRSLTFMLSFCSCGSGVVCVLVTKKSTFKQIKTSHQAKQLPKHWWAPLLALAPHQRWTASWRLPATPAPCTRGCFSSSCRRCVWESGYWHLCWSQEECCCGGLEGGRIIRGKFMWLLTSLFSTP